MVMLVDAYDESMNPKNIKRGFRDTGIFPENRDLLLQSGKLAPSTAFSTRCPSPVIPRGGKKHDTFVETMSRMLDKKFDRVFERGPLAQPSAVAASGKYSVTRVVE